MIHTALVLTVLVLATAASALDDNKCWGSFERCAGAPGKPYVHYGKGCCDAGDECKTAEWLGYGKWCLKKAPEYYKIGELCAGGPGWPYVPYAPCKDSVCTPAPAISSALSYCVQEACFPAGMRCGGFPGKCCPGTACGGKQTGGKCAKIGG